MNAADTPGPGDHIPSAGRCASCTSRLASDQRYCVNCGTRRGPLPASVEATLGELRRRGLPEPVAEPAANPAADLVPVGAADAAADNAAADGASSGGWLPNPRAIALAVMAMLSFGVVCGSLTSAGGAESLARTLVVSLAPSAPPTGTTNNNNNSGNFNAGSSGGGGTPAAITETITEAAPASSTGGGSDTSSDTTTTSGSGSGSGGLLNLPPIKHVFVIMLSNQGYNQSFGSTTGHPYLSSTLRKQGELINDYYGVASSPLANEIALLSGQGPTWQTDDNCPVFTDISPATKGADAQVIGDGCVYPQATQTLADELTDNGNSWKAYVQGVDQGATGQPKSCRYPTLNSADPNQTATATDPYATWINPFVYFGSLTSGGECSQQDVGIKQLSSDLKKLTTTPNFSYIAPDPCDDGSDQPCTTGAPAGLARSDKFLKSVVPEIEASPAYKQDGLIVITFDEAPQTGALADNSSCCDQPTFPNLQTPPPESDTGTTTTGTTTTGTTTTGTTTTTTSSTAPATTTDTTTTSATTTPGATTPASTTSPTIPATTTSGTTTGCTTTGTSTTGTTSTGTSSIGTTTTGANDDCNTSGSPPGGGQVGALLISKYVKAGSDDAVDTFNHYSLLKTIEDLFSIGHLGYTTDKSLPVFDTAIFNNSSSS